jgi:hypothetical protein
MQPYNAGSRLRGLEAVKSSKGRGNYNGGRVKDGVTCLRVAVLIQAVADMITDTAMDRFDYYRPANGRFSGSSSERERERGTHIESKGDAFNSETQQTDGKKKQPD